MGMQLSHSELVLPMSARAPQSVMLGRSAAMGRVREAVARVAATDFSVLAIGESGSGKELVARSVHEQSQRRLGPFIAVNCGAISPGLIEAELFGHERGSFTGAVRSHAGVFERAEGGTLFLDEITEMPAELQTRLLRVLESRTFYRVGGTAEMQADVRIIAATNRNPVESVREQRLREDLLYRIAVFPIAVPPLRARGEDAIEIADAFLVELNLRCGSGRQFSARSIEFLRDYRWPGNVRELRNVVERGFVMADEEIDLMPTLAGFDEDESARGAAGAVSLAIGSTLEEAERAMIEATLRHMGGNKPRTAAALGCSLKTLYNKLNGYSQVPRMAGA